MRAHPRTVVKLVAIILGLLLAMACSSRSDDLREPVGHEESAVVKPPSPSGIGVWHSGQMENYLSGLVGGFHHDCGCPADGWVGGTCDCVSGDPPACWPYACSKYRPPYSYEAAFLRKVVGDIAQTILRNGFRDDWHYAAPTPSYVWILKTYDGETYALPELWFLANIGYELDQFYDAVMDRVLIVLKPITIPDPKNRNWGIFIFNERPSNYNVIEVPHPTFDQATELEGVEAFEASDAMALFIAGEHRMAINHPTDSDAKAVADVAHRHAFTGDTTPDGYSLQSGFEAAHEAVLDVLTSGPSVGGAVHNAIVQLHGFDETVSTTPPRPTEAQGRLVISSGVSDCLTGPGCDLANTVIAQAPQKTEHGAVFDGPAPAAELALTPATGFNVVEGETNFQKDRCTTKGVPFLHVEADKPARSLTARYDTGATDSLLRPFLARQIMYMVDDWSSSGGMGLVPPGGRSPDFGCDLTGTTNPLLGFDNNESPDANDPTTALQVDSTMLGLAHNSKYSFVGYQLGDDLYLPVDHASTQLWTGHRERLVRAGWKVFPLWIGPPNACDTCSDISSANAVLGADTLKTKHGAASAYDSLESEGFDADSTIVLDLEQSATDINSLPYTKEYLLDWFNWWKPSTGHNVRGYKLGIYCSTDLCGSIRTVLEDPANLGSSFADNNVLYWEFNSNCGGTATTHLNHTRNTDGSGGSPGCFHPTTNAEYLWVDPGTATDVGFAMAWQYATTLGATPSGGEIDDCVSLGYGYGTGSESGDPSVGPVCHLVGESSAGFGDYYGYDFFGDLDSFRTPCSAGGAGSGGWMPSTPRRFVRDQSITLSQKATTLYNCVSNPNCDVNATASTLAWTTNEVSNAIALYQAGGAKIVNYRLVENTWYSDLPTHPQPIANGGFEVNGLAGWSSTGVTAVVSGGGPISGGASAARVGSTQPSTDSTLAKTFTIPSKPTVLSLQYKVVCPDTVTYDQVWATLYDAATQQTTTILPQTCTNTGSWLTIDYDVSSKQGHSVTLTFHNHDDNNGADPTYSLFDNVILHAAPVNGDFESGTLGSWTATGSTSVVSGNSAWTGTYAAQIGASSPTTDNTLAQTFTIPTTATYLNLAYNIVCPDTLTFDQVWVTLYDTVTQATYTVLPQTCTNGQGWTGLNYVLPSGVAGHSVTLTLRVHDDDYPSDPTYAQFDGVVVF